MTAALLAVPDRFLRAGLSRALAASGFEVVAEPVEAQAAVAAARSRTPALALVAVDLPGDGLEAVRGIAAVSPRTRVVVISARPHGEELVDAVLAGAVGYLSAEMRQERLPDIAHGVLAGETSLPRLESRHILDALRRRHSRRAVLASRTGAVLSEREWEVLQLMADGLSTGELARRLGISAVTARRHISSAMAKLGVRDRESAVELVRTRSSP